MLLGGGKANIKQVAVITRNLKFNKLLSSILADWRFFAVEDLSAAKVIFAERGIKLPVHNAQVIWLTPMPLSEENFLETNEYFIGANTAAVEAASNGLWEASKGSDGAVNFNYVVTNAAGWTATASGLGETITVSK